VAISPAGRQPGRLLAALEKALNAELTELSNVITSIDQSHAISGQQSFSSVGSLLGSKRGWSAADTPQDNTNKTSGPAMTIDINVIP
jgi:hypothetical protein